jgi:hypothetical protein
MNDNEILKGCSIRLHGLDDEQYKQILRLMEKARQDEREKCERVGWCGIRVDELQAENANLKRSLENAIFTLREAGTETGILKAENAELKARWEKLERWLDASYNYNAELGDSGNEAIICVKHKMQELESKKAEEAK